jgi:DNA replication protein DnaC
MKIANTSGKITTPIYHCPKCRDTGFIQYWKEVDGLEYEFFRECECGLIETKRETARKLDSNIPEKYRGLELSDFKLDFYGDDRKIATTIKSAFKGYISDFMSVGKGLYLFGKTKGTGKTRGACIVLNELQKKGYSVKFTNSGQILQDIKDSWSERAAYERTVIDDLREIDILLIDDFGVEKANDWRQEQYYNIINERYMSKRVTIFTSNYDLKELENINYDSRIISRIKESCILLPFPGTSIRDEMAKQNQMELRELIK